MVLEVVKYGHPALRQKGAPIHKIGTEIKHLVADMLETMVASNGVGLAAQQIGKALQLTVVDVSEITDRASTLEVDGQPVDVATAMPLVLINPQIRPFGKEVCGPEGCLSFPEMYGDITRPESVEVTALDAGGHSRTFRAGGLLSRAIQHEVDHLNGILFIDRMDRETRQGLKLELDELQAATKAELKLAARR